jgi:serine/threonine-protein kinase
MMRPGARIGRYTVVGPVGRGEPGGLFEVHDEANRKFVMRSPIGDLEDSADAVTKQFFPIADSLRSIAHNNLVVLFDVFVEAGQLFMVTEKASGRGLATAIDAGLGPRKSLVIARQLLEALIAVHAAGQVHRDLQPSKIFLVAMNGWDLIKLTDSGLGMLFDEAVLAYGAGALIGSLPKPNATYMAPEQVLGRSVDPRTDLYSVGVLVFEMLAGRPPFPDRDPELVRELHVRVPPPKLAELCPDSPWCTPPMLALVDTALAKDREARFPDARAMQAAVDAAFASLEHLPPE